MSSPCDAFEVGQVVFQNPILGQLIIVRVENGKVVIAPYIGGPELEWDCAEFWERLSEWLGGLAPNQP